MSMHLKFEARDGVWRVAFAFDPKRQAIVLVAGDKSSPKPMSVSPPIWNV